MKHLLAILFTFVLSTAAWSQTTISGRVTDATTGDPLPYVALRGVNIRLGAVTDFDGYYTITTSEPIDSLMATYMGYTNVKKAVVLNQQLLLIKGNVLHHSSQSQLQYPRPRTQMA